jgi:hypothetical protein
MKRSAGAFMALACLSGCMSDNRTGMPTKFGQAAVVKPVNGYQGPYGEPISRGAAPGVAPASYDSPKPGANLIQTGFLDRSTCSTCSADGTPNGVATIDPSTGKSKHNYPPPEPMVPRFYPGQGITPVPQMGPSGAVAAIGAMPIGGPRIPTGMRTSVRFGDPAGMKVTWYGPNGWNDVPLETPAKYNFLQCGVYRLKLTSIPNRVEKVYYPTLDVQAASPKTLTYLAHTCVPLTFTDEDFEQVDSGNFLVKVVYLPDPQFQDLATVVGPNELVSTRLEPGVDPVVEAQKRGTILLVVRMGNIDLQAPNTPAMDAPNPYMMQGMPRVMPPKKDEKMMPLPLPKPILPKDDNGKPSVLPTLP